MTTKKTGIVDRNQSAFEEIKQTNEYGQDFWSARQLAKVLGYSDYRNFVHVIDKAKEACKNSGNEVNDHFVDITEMVTLGSGAKREIQSMALSRYACYLIVQNADPAKDIVALGQTYFAVQTRKQELAEQEEFQRLGTEEEKRLFLRDELKTHNKKLAEAARNAGVIQPIDYAIFQDNGYMGLYGELTAKNIHQRKGLKKSQKILDHMGSTELAANLFRATQTEDKIRRENIKGKNKANQTHYQVGQKVRQTIKELGGTMPEDLPTVESIKKIAKQKQKELK
ncbi:MAG: DNA damage-inducible protein D [Candidatus Aminicenantes bacterium]|nr:MAG: DNA damage-inducible protein D [Candidatus Aminicenantes bacterium]